MPYYNIPIIFTVEGDDEQDAAENIIDAVDEAFYRDHLGDAVDSWHSPNHRKNDPEDPVWVPATRTPDWRESPVYAVAARTVRVNLERDGYEFHYADAEHEALDSLTDRHIEAVYYSLFEPLREHLIAHANVNPEDD